MFSQFFKDQHIIIDFATAVFVQQPVGLFFSFSPIVISLHCCAKDSRYYLKLEYNGRMSVQRAQYIVYTVQ